MERPKHVHIVTIGDDVEHVFTVVRELSGIDVIFILYTENNEYTGDKYETIAKQVQTRLLVNYPDVRIVPVGLEDFYGIVQTIYGIEKDFGIDTRYTINITGGTKLISAAAYFSAYYIRAETYYSQTIKKDGEIVPELTKVINIESPYPIEIKNYTKLQKGILKYIYQVEEEQREKIIHSKYYLQGDKTKLDEEKIKKKPKTLSNEDIEAAFKISKQRAHSNLLTLEERKVIKMDPNGNFTSIRLTPQGKMIGRYIDAEDVLVCKEW